MDFDWDYGQRKVHLLMLLYVTDALTRFRHNNPQNPQHQPYPHIRTNYGAKAQYAESADVYPPLSIANKNLDKKSRGLFCIMHGQ